MIKNIYLFFSLLTFCSLNVFSQCPPLDFTPLNTGTNMTLLITGGSVSTMNVIGQGSIGVFYTDDNGLLICGGSTTCAADLTNILVVVERRTNPLYK